MTSGDGPAFFAAVIGMAISILGSVAFLVWSRRFLSWQMRLAMALAGPVSLYFLAINLENIPAFLGNSGREAGMMLLLGMALGVTPNLAGALWIRSQQRQA